jgi:hypothetical protein
MVTPRPREVDRPGEELLAHPGLAVDEHGGVDGGDHARQIEHLLHHRTTGDDVLQGEPRLVPAQARAARRFQPLELDCPAQHQLDLGHLERLHQVVLGPEPHRLDRRSDAAVRGHHHDRQMRVLDLDPAHQIDAVHPGQPLVGQDEIEVVHAEAGERLFAASDGEDLVARHLERPLQRAHEDLVVLDDQDVVLHGRPPVRGAHVRHGHDEAPLDAASGPAGRAKLPRRQ